MSVFEAIKRVQELFLEFDLCKIECRYGTRFDCNLIRVNEKLSSGQEFSNHYSKCVGIIQLYICKSLAHRDHYFFG